ncbi:outer membrane protein assembly factor BamB family protein [Micromonospora sp. URMC 103]|uniref:outer membrane protein assembly factor BamB family protein n=1 Tax=Micromonospora sp. URMC 103 TaxID=3423406 RepID=UPI003F1C6924
MAAVTDRLIDLGELRHEPEPEALPRPPRAVGRPLRCALVLLLALATLVAGAPVPRREVVVVPAVFGTEALLADDLFLVIEPGVLGRQRAIDAYRLPGGKRAWRAPLPVQGRYWGMFVLGRTLLVTGYQQDGRSNVTVALDRTTGAYRWQQPGNALVGGGALLLETGDDERGRTLRSVDPCCGSLRWQVDFPPGGQLTYRNTEAGADRVVHSTVDGQVEVRSSATGAVLARTDLWGPADDRMVNVQVAGDLLLAVGGGPAAVAAYDLDRLRPRWRVEVEDALYASECGPVICVQGRSGGLLALDPGTGRRLWADDRWAGVWSSRGRLVASAVSSAGPGAEQLALLDPTTGTVLGELGRWELAHPGRPDGRLIGVRQYRGAGRLLVAELDVVAGTARPLDVLRGAAGDCQSSDDRLVCRRLHGDFGVWPLPG